MSCSVFPGFRGRDTKPGSAWWLESSQGPSQSCRPSLELSEALEHRPAKQSAGLPAPPAAAAAAPARPLERPPLPARLAPSRAAGGTFKRSALLLAAFFASAEVCVGIITKTDQKYALDFSGFLPSLLIRVPPVPGPSSRQDFPWGWRWPGGPSRTAVCRTEQGQEEWKRARLLPWTFPVLGRLGLMGLWGGRGWGLLQFRALPARLRIACRENGRL